MNDGDQLGAHWPQSEQLSFLLPKEQFPQRQAGVLLPPIHLPHSTQLSFLFPKEQLLQRWAGALLFPIHLPQLQQLSFLFPKEQLLHSMARTRGIKNQLQPQISYNVNTNHHAITDILGWAIIGMQRLLEHAASGFPTTCLPFDYISIPTIQMSTHDELPDDIRKQISDFEGKLSSLKGVKGAGREQALGKLEKHLKRIRRIMDTYQYSIQSGAFENKVDSHKSQYKQFEQALNRLEKGLANSRGDAAEEDDLFKYRNKSNKNVDPNNRQAVIQMGHQAQKESEEALKRIGRNVAVMDEQADLIVTEMDRQIKKLDEIYDELSDTETTLKRAEKHLKYFAKQIYTDRLMICMIIVIAIAIIVIIALAIAGKTPKAMRNTV